VQKFLSIKK